MWVAESACNVSLGGEQQLMIRIVSGIQRDLDMQKVGHYHVKRMSTAVPVMPGPLLDIAQCPTVKLPADRATAPCCDCRAAAALSAVKFSASARFPLGSALTHAWCSLTESTY